MTALPSQPEQAEGLNHSSRGLHARVRPRTMSPIELLRPEGALHPALPGNGQPARLRGTTRRPLPFPYPKSNPDPALEPLICVENTLITHPCPSLLCPFSPITTAKSNRSNRNQTESGQKMKSVIGSLWKPPEGTPCSSGRKSALISFRHLLSGCQPLPAQGARGNRPRPCGAAASKRGEDGPSSKLALFAPGGRVPFCGHWFRKPSEGNGRWRKPPGHPLSGNPQFEYVLGTWSFSGVCMLEFGHSFRKPMSTTPPRGSYLCA